MRTDRRYADPSLPIPERHQHAVAAFRERLVDFGLTTEAADGYATAHADHILIPAGGGAPYFVDEGGRALPLPSEDDFGEVARRMAQGAPAAAKGRPVLDETAHAAARRRAARAF